MSILKELSEVIKQKRQFNHDLRRIESSNLDYEALKRIVEKVASTGVSITVTFENGTKMEIKHGMPNENNFKSFADLYKAGK